MYDDIILTMRFMMSQIVFKCPKDTYNLVNSIGYNIKDDKTATIFIGGKKAPYFTDTNDKRLKGNPQYGAWWDETIAQSSMVLANAQNGYLFRNVKG